MSLIGSLASSSQFLLPQSGGAPARRYAPTAPWSRTAQPNPANDSELLSKAAKEALRGANFINEGAAKLDLPQASKDYKKLFALYNGLKTLSQLAEDAQSKTISKTAAAELNRVFKKGVAEVIDYVKSTRFEGVRLSIGEVSSSARATSAARSAAAAYQTPPLVATDQNAVSDALQGDVKFTMSIVKAGVTKIIDVDLASVAPADRTLPNFVNLVNTQLQAEGLTTRFETKRVPGQERTITAGGRTISLGRDPDSWALNLKLDAAEKVTLIPVTTVPAVYIAQKAGNPDPDGNPTTKDGVLTNQFLKFQTGPDTLSPPNVLQSPQGLVAGQVWSRSIDAALTSVRSMKTLADGSVLILSDVTGASPGQQIRGERDVVLQKFDSAGKLLFSRDLGASDEAFGMSMAVAADGRIAIAGKVKGVLEGAKAGPISETKGDVTDSFVTVFNAAGEEVWTQRRGSVGNDEATHLAWDSSGKLYVAGNSSAGRGGQAAIGQSDVFLERYETDVNNNVTYSASTVVGGAGKDLARGLFINGSDLYLASNDGGSGVVRRFDLSTGSPVLQSTRDLGSLEGGDLTGLGMADGRLIVAGNTGGGNINVGNIVSAYSGGRDGFVARMSASLSVSAEDRLTYYGGTSEDVITGVSIQNDRVFVTGTSKGNLPSLNQIATIDGFVAEIDPVSGGTPWSRRFTGKDGIVAPSAIAVDTAGASVLDRLGLPTGTLNVADSTRLDAISSIRTGDQLQVRRSLNGQTTTITVKEGDTLTTLADRMKRALGSQADVRVMTDEGGRRLQIKPASDGNVIELVAGPKGKDALQALGLKEGVLRQTDIEKGGKIVPADGRSPIFGLRMNTKINLDNLVEMRHAAAELAGAISELHSVYRELRDASTPAAVKAAEAARAAGKQQVPLYLQKQIANYTEGLNRLTGVS
ncbi:hypothetical protein [Phenylobacterium sp.]|uniref:hypothetical protein n=1 Tax=Phenylobacterium sp. TaxID=1871053 RepID=UPI002FDCC608